MLLIYPNINKGQSITFSPRVQADALGQISMYLFLKAEAMPG